MHSKAGNSKINIVEKVKFKMFEELEPKSGYIVVGFNNPKSYFPTLETYKEEEVPKIKSIELDKLRILRNRPMDSVWHAEEMAEKYNNLSSFENSEMLRIGSMETASLRSLYLMASESHSRSIRRFCLSTCKKEALHRIDSESNSWSRDMLKESLETMEKMEEANDHRRSLTEFEIEHLWKTEKHHADRHYSWGQPSFLSIWDCLSITIKIPYYKDPPLALCVFFSIISHVGRSELRMYEKKMLQILEEWHRFQADAVFKDAKKLSDSLLQRRGDHKRLKEDGFINE